MRPERRYPPRRVTRRAPQPSGPDQLRAPLKRGPRPTRRRVWVGVTLLCSALTWSIFPRASEDSAHRVTQEGLKAVERHEEMGHHDSEPQGDMTTQDDPALEGEARVQRALRWRVEGARLGEAGLSPCAPVGWRGERVSPLDPPQAGGEFSGVTWRPPSSTEGGGLHSQAILLQEGALTLLSTLNPEGLRAQGAVGQSLMRHQRLASCVMGPGAELHDPWLSKSWGGERWRAASPLESLDRWVQLSTAEGGWHHSVGLSRLGLPEQALDHHHPRGRALLRALIRAWLLGVTPESIGLGSWSLTASDKLNDWLGAPEMLIWRPQTPELSVNASTLRSSTRTLSKQARTLLSSLESKPARTVGKGEVRAKPQSGKRLQRRRGSPVKRSSPPSRPVKRLKLQYD